MDTRIIISPSKYIQGYNELSKISEYTKTYGKSPFIIADDFVLGLTKDIISNSYSDGKYHMHKFNGECSKQEINRLMELCKDASCDIVVGIGGGKTLDTAKAISYYLKLPVVIAPTIASTDAPCSALSVIYTETGEFDEYLLLPSNPNIVLMDTKIISEAPVRLLVAGMGDALATYFEARACNRSNSKTMAGAHSTNASLALARLCYDTLLESGLKAKLAAENKVSTKALENIIEANTYLSGIGFESGGLGAAHAIHNGFTVLEECHHLYHGEKVAFGTITQLVLEDAPIEEIEEVILFCLEVDLPVTLSQMGITKINKDDIMKVAKGATAEGETIHNMPFKVTASDVYSAILTADKLGQLYI